MGRPFLLVAVVGSGTRGERLAGGSVAIVLLANAAATAGALYLLIKCPGPISGAHFNPLVTLAMALRGDLAWAAAPAYMAAQMAAAVVGVVPAGLMFDTPALVASHIGSAYWLTSSTSFANAAVTAARTPTETFAGIRSADARGFMLAQCFGAATAVVVCRLPVPGSALPAAVVASSAAPCGIESQPEHPPPAVRRRKVR